MSNVTVRQLLAAGVHFGHQTRYWCPKMSPYIYGHKNKIHIINLEQTLEMFNDAMNYLGSVASKRGNIMFVGTKRQAGAIIQEEAIRAGCPYVYHRWLGGMLTNYRTIRRSIDRLNELDSRLEEQNAAGLTKKELMHVKRERFRLDRNLAGIREMSRIPDVLFVIDVKHENIAVAEARKLGIPVVAVVDTNCDPDNVDYIIPGNDDAISAIRLYCSVAADAIIEGRTSASDLQESEFDYTDEQFGKISVYKVTGAQAAVAPIRDGTLEDEEEEYLEPEAESEVASVADSVQESSPEEEPESTVTEGEELSQEEPATAVEEATVSEPEEPAAVSEEATASEPEEPESASLSLSEEQEKELDQLSKKTEKIRYLGKLNWEPAMIAEKVDCRVSYVNSTLSKTKEA